MVLIFELNFAFGSLSIYKENKVEILVNRASTKLGKANPMTIISEIQSTIEQSNILP